jgi:polyhydroxybutyrate depolymerase
VWHDDQRVDDFTFAHNLVAELKTTMCIDPARVYAAGHSNGGVFAASLVCRAPQEFAAVAVVAGVPLSQCPDGVQPDMIEILGTADDITLYEGRLRRPGAEESITSWASNAGCPHPPVVEPVRDGVEALRFGGCSVADVELLSVIDGAHPWPGGLVAMNRAGNSEAGRTFPATQTILDFFDDHVGVG